MSFSLNCLVLGKASANIFRMRFSDLVPIGGLYVRLKDLTVADFKDALSEKEQTKGITEMNIWKVELGFHEINNFSNEDTIKNHDKSEKFDDNPMLNFSTYYSNADDADDDKKPKDGYLHIFIVPNSTVQDVSAQVLGAFNKRPKVTLPEINELPDFLEQPLSDNMKIPILRHEYNSYLIQSMEDTCTPEDLNILFRISDTESAYEFITKTLGSPIRNNPPSREGTEYSFVHFWDNNIRSLLEILISNGTTIRNSSQHTSTPGKRPDFGFILGHVCPFRGEEGEEKSLINNEDPRNELIDKLTWTYDPAPYILGYYANGPDVTFVAISPPLSTGNKPKISTIVNSNLSLRKDRIINLRRMINLSILIKSLQDVIGWRESPEFSQIVRDKQTIEVYGTNIKKTYKIPEELDWRVEKLKNVYNILTEKSVPNVDRLICANNENGVVYLGPKGMSVKPNSLKELFEAILCVLEALVVMHGGDNPIFHQDIRWPNIIKLSGEPPKWILIDWDDADRPQTRTANHLEKTNHAPEVFLQGHGGEVDIWSVGKLITDADHFIMGLPQSIIDIGVQMQSDDRPNALNALETWRSLSNSNIF